MEAEIACFGFILSDFVEGDPVYTVSHPQSSPSFSILENNLHPREEILIVGCNSDDVEEVVFKVNAGLRCGVKDNAGESKTSQRIDARKRA